MRKAPHSLRKEIIAARSWVREILEADAIEAETRRRLEDIFVQVLGYDKYGDLSREKAVKGVGDTEHVDFAVKIEGEFKFFVELKRVSAALAPKHIKQAARYAVDSGLNWVILTNTVQWELYHIDFRQPPVTSLVMRFDLLQDDLGGLEKKIRVVTKKAVRRGSLDELWGKARSLSVDNLLKAILADDSIRAIRRNIRRSTEVLVAVEEIVSALKKILNERGLSAMENISVTLSPRPQRRARRQAAAPGTEDPTHPAEGPDLTPAETASPEVPED